CPTRSALSPYTTLFRSRIIMNGDQSSGKKRQQFTIIKDDSTDGHGGYGMGAISLENMSSIIVDPNENRAYVDMSAMHARSDVERSEEHTSELQSRFDLV